MIDKNERMKLENEIRHDIQMLGALKTRPEMRPIKKPVIQSAQRPEQRVEAQTQPLQKQPKQSLQNVKATTTVAREPTESMQVRPDRLEQVNKAQTQVAVRQEETAFKQFPSDNSNKVMDMIDQIGKGATPQQRELLIRKKYEETMGRQVEKKVRSMVIFVIDDTYDDAHSAFDFAVAGATIGMDIHMYFTNRGINILRKDYKPVRTRGSPVMLMERMLRKAGVSTLAELMFQAKDLGVHMYGCYASLKAVGLKEKDLIGGITVLRSSEFLSATIGADVQLAIG